MSSYMGIIDLKRIPIVTKAVCAATLALSLFSWLLRYRHWASTGDEETRTDAGIVKYVTLVPASSFYLPWTLITNQVVSSNLVTLVISFAVLLLGGRYLERAWSSRELAQFYLIVGLSTSISMYIGLVFLSGLTRDTAYIHYAIYGSSGLQAAILVAFKQLVPEHTVTLFKDRIKIRVRHIPAIYLLCTSILALLLGHFQTIPTAITGFFASWVYLRFYKPAPPDLAAHSVSLHGDASETFRLSGFFPDFAHGQIDYISDKVFDLLVSLGICIPFGDQEERNDYGHRTTPNVANRAEAERRRALALKALSTRSQAKQEAEMMLNEPGPESMPQL
ncbi:eukaryotic integral membrane protein-domain-containing protein [Protomyces lactucae-debilis]|uniref:Eukaryotic integral membrane protein-domain-containing protein n=1 Tax=Protomyces lactucae-debilis TaxID=2754530 RepID=A0A1Y2FC52_PROLT|nr:eukaryotic integral membrane protein-domain-containing protein [Protomyces lactucae-debilis]ORY80906.1 eukaryotic integral membrane protein-domain-containing protein [Protomyces lactucae-debilis]